MNNIEEYYETRHRCGDNYAGKRYDLQRLLNLACLKSWSKSLENKSINILDVGCGKGFFLKDTIRLLKRDFSIECALSCGVDIVKSKDNIFGDIEAEFEFIQQNLDNERLKMPDSKYDLIICNHVLEHVFETENLLSEIYRVMKPGGVCIISVPNLASWVNRLFLLLGVRPLGVEAGTKSITYGFPLAKMKKHLARFTPAGHLRAFTPKALRDIVESVGFETLGWWNQDVMRMMRITKWSGRGMGLIGIKNKADRGYLC